MDVRRRNVLVEIELIGERKNVSTLRVEETLLGQSVLKVQTGNGYDHFVLDRHERREERVVAVYVWVQRTRIAE
jgi:hypothetical protein